MFESRSKVLDFEDGSFVCVQSRHNNGRISLILLFRMRKVFYVDLKESIIIVVVIKQPAEHWVTIKSVQPVTKSSEYYHKGCNLTAVNKQTQCDLADQSLHYTYNFQ